MQRQRVAHRHRLGPAHDDHTAQRLLERLRPDKLAPASDRVPDRFETGTPAYELYAGVAAAVEHLAALSPDAAGWRPPFPLQ